MEQIELIEFWRNYQFRYRSAVEPRPLVLDQGKESGHWTPTVRPFTLKVRSKLRPALLKRTILPDPGQLKEPNR